MRKSVIILMLASLLASCSSYQRIGDLNLIANRNIDKSEDYVLLVRNVEGVARMKNQDALENAVDVLTEKYKGEYIMNAKIYVKDNGKKIKIEGDVWGTKEAKKELESQKSNKKSIFGKKKQ